MQPRLPEGIGRAGALTLGVLLVLKLALLLHSGPLRAYDSAEYLRFADTIRAGDAWLTDADLVESPIPTTTFRAVGYPLLIAGSHRVLGADWAYGLIGLQLAASLLAAGAFYLLARRIGLGDRGAAALLLCFGTSYTLVWDQYLLTDGLYAALVFLVIATLSTSYLAGRAPHRAAVLGLGIVLAACTLLREATPYLLVSFAPLLLLWSLRCAPRPRWAAGLLLLLLAPTLLTLLGYRGWNRARTGHPFVTTSAQTAMLFPLSDLARRGVPVFGGDRPLDRAVREAAPNLRGLELYRVSEVLHRDLGWTAIDVARAADAAYAEAWRRYPVGMALESLRRLPPVRITFVRPMRSVLLILSAPHGRDPAAWPGRRRLLERLRAERRPTDALLILGATVFPLASTALLVAFLLGPPLDLRRRLGATIPERRRLVLALWLGAIGFTLTYALVHLELRYLTPVVPVVLLVAGVTIQDLVRRRSEESG